MYCTQCGNEIIEGAKFCTKCGKKVVLKTDTIQAKTIQLNHVNSNSVQASLMLQSKNGKKYKIIIPIVLLVIVILVILIISAKNKEQMTDVQPVNNTYERTDVLEEDYTESETESMVFDRDSNQLISDTYCFSFSDTDDKMILTINDIQELETTSYNVIFLKDFAGTELCCRFQKGFWVDGAYSDEYEYSKDSLEDILFWAPYYSEKEIIEFTNERAVVLRYQLDPGTTGINNPSRISGAMIIVSNSKDLYYMDFAIGIDDYTYDYYTAGDHSLTDEEFDAIYSFLKETIDTLYIE